MVGVSPSTVSRAFSRPGRVKAETAEHVRAAAARLGYRTNPPARALSTGRSSMVALVIPDVTNPVYFDITRGAEDAAAEAGYTLVLADFRESGRLEREAIDRAVPAVEGLVLGGPRIPDSAIRTAAKQRPVVVLNRAVADISSVVTDNPRGMRRAAEHLGLAVNARGADHNRSGAYEADLSGDQLSQMDYRNMQDTHRRNVAERHPAIGSKSHHRTRPWLVAPLVTACCLVPPGPCVTVDAHARSFTGIGYALKIWR